jgi:TonB family protein
MFGNLVESSSHKGDYARRSWFFFGTLTVYALIFLAIGVGSIYAYNTHIENQNLELVTLITPVESPQAQTPQRRTTPRPAAGGNNSSNKVVVRSQPVIATMDPQRIAGKASVSSTVPELPSRMNYTIGIPGPGDNIFGNSGNKTGGGSGDGDSTSKEMEELTKTTPPPVMETKPSKPPATKLVKSMGVVNGMATDLPKPVYSAIAKAAGARGIVTVQVLIDENGKVISARVLSGHPLLQKESVQAAYQARFTPTLLSNQPVKVSGVITYNFVR